MKITGKRPGGDGGLDDFTAQFDTKAGSVDACSQFVIVREIFGERREASLEGGVESSAGNGKRGAESEVEALFQEARCKNAGDEVSGDAQGFES